MERTEKVKRTTAILLEETIEELEQKRKAVEAQNRELEIESSLERVRSRMMAMHNSSELEEVIAAMYKQLSNLKLEVDVCTINIFHEGSRDLNLWIATPDQVYFREMRVPFFDNPLFTRTFEAKEKGESFFSDRLTRQEKDAYYHHAIENSAIGELITEERKKNIFGAKSFTRSFSISKHTGLMIANFNEHEYTPHENGVIRRFGQVFEQAYTRFLDLQKAEKQAWEAQIEAALERVRSKTMAMHNSEDVGITVAALFDEVLKLGIDKTIRCGIGILEDKERMELWSASLNVHNKVDLYIGLLDMNIHPLLIGAKQAWKNGDTGYTYELTGNDVRVYYDALNKQPDYDFQIDLESLPERIVNNSFFFKEGLLFAFTANPLSADAALVLKRFTGVFGQTYRRFLDLKKAEAQAREARIEAALERVRAKAMAMHNSNDLSITASVVFTELRKLGITPLRCGVGLLNRESRKAQLYSATSSNDGDSLSLVGWVVLTGHPVLEKIYDSWLDNEEYYPDMSGVQLKSYYELLLKGLPVPVPDWQDGQKQYGTFLPFSVGCLYAWSKTPYNDDETKILKRFATIIDLTFRRYIELQKSEYNAREAVKQAALDRIRAEIASMRSKEDLERITPLIWRELTTLEVPFFRCGVFIMDEAEQVVHVYLSAPDGHSLGILRLPFQVNSLTAHAVDNWRKGEVYIEHWDAAAFSGWMQSMVEAGQIRDKHIYQGAETAPESLDLHFIPFAQGMLYVGNDNRLDEVVIDLVKSMAEAFSIAYSRYEDFNKLEAAKLQVDKTLSELKQAQSQLVQSEKMASLGELTAGIAHEIQNPLNFVNNFSEVSNELLDEMMEEVAKGNFEEVKGILKDVKQNLEKINHHGKRADGIVKGMLQHSRSSSGSKEPADINVLADEYLRLAYHGLRAKDKFFNVTMKTEYDEGIEKASVIAQDIGRVILNLITNAFYAVNEKKKLSTGDYEPIVFVSTKKTGDRIQLSVADNGNGIPQNIIDKIFQPFFTTKPTGQGTGLGLSLAYDIVKAHGGELKVETREGEGSEFMIFLPMI